MLLAPQDVSTIVVVYRNLFIVIEQNGSIDYIVARLSD